MTFTHLVLTRFNLRLQKYAADKAGRPIRDASWMAHRTWLFERVCLTSMEAQDSSHWRWLVFCDRGTDLVDRQRLEVLQAAHPCFELVWLPDADVQRFVRQLELPAGRLVTTRLDNDDAFHPAALSTIAQEALAVTCPSLLSFRYGIHCDGHKGVVHRHTRNPFQSLVEEIDTEHPPATALCGLAHGHLVRVAPMRLLPDVPYRLTLIHGRNLVNRMADDHRRVSLLQKMNLIKWLKQQLVKPLARLFWPAELRRVRSWDEVAMTFNLRLSAEELPIALGDAPDLALK